MNFKEQLKTLGPEFMMVMDQEKEVTYEKVYNFILHINKLDEEYKLLNADQQHELFNMFRDFYSFGFYNGVKFILDPDNLHKETIDKIYNS